MYRSPLGSWPVTRAGSVGSFSSAWEVGRFSSAWDLALAGTSSTRMVSIRNSRHTLRILHPPKASIDL